MPAQATSAGGLSRREFMVLGSMAAAGYLTGCATNPVTGRRQLMLISEEEEIQIDKQYAPYQFSSDYEVSQDSELNRYVDRIGKQMARGSHRPQMPYSFRVVNATYVNAYAFPGGSIAVTRGILLKLDNEAELASLLGHELGHVNARHTAQQMSKGALTQAVIGGISAATGAALGSGYGQMAAQLGMLGAGALLASYSRDNEREADALGLTYTVRSGYSATGFTGLMDMLRNLSKSKPGYIELMFATHPMSEERYRTAVRDVRSKYTDDRSKPLYRERYMDHTAGLRNIRGAVEALQRGETDLANQRYPEADRNFSRALKIAPGDYVALVMTAKSKYLQKDYSEALRFARRARQSYPAEAQAWHISGIANIQLRQFEAAHENFDRYDKLLPGNPQVLFFKGYALEGMNRKEAAADHYYRFLQQVNQGEEARYAYRRLVEWGYIKQ
jgi:predicted Zn-dependent protease